MMPATQLRADSPRPAAAVDDKAHQCGDLAATAEMSFVIVNWNTCALTLQCLRSILAQAGPFRHEIIVVDNGSLDDSIVRIREELPHVMLIANERNLGFAAANNIGLRACTGRYALLINSDVILREGCLAALWQFMEQHPDAGMVAPKILNRDLTLQESCKEFPTLWSTFCRALALDTLLPGRRLFSSHLMRYWSHNDCRTVDILSGCFWMVRREALEKVGLLDERFFMYAEDKDWCRRYWDAGWPVYYLPDAEAIHLSESSSARDPIRFYVEMIRANLSYWRKHSTPGQLAAFRVILILHEALRLLATALRYALIPSGRQASANRLRRTIAACRCVLFSH